MPKVIELNESVKQMTLNADNRRAFTNAILNDVLLARSNAVRKEMAELQNSLINRTWGATPQARAANKKLADSIKLDIKTIENKGIYTNDFCIGRNSSRLDINFGGRSARIYFKEKPSNKPIIDFKSEFFNSDDYLVDGENVSNKSQHLGGNLLTLTTDDQLTVKFWKLLDEAKEIKEAGDQITAILNSVLGKAKTLGAALNKWPELSQYAPAILSACREITVPTETLNRILDDLKDGKKPVSKIMKAANE